MSGFAVIDLETTGLNPRSDAIIEVGIILLDSAGAFETGWTSLVNPGQSVRAQFVHGITDDDVESSPTFTEILPQVVPRLESRAIVAHNAAFDVGFLNEGFRKAGFPMHIPAEATVCTMELSKMYLPPGRHSLASAAERAGVQMLQHHRALADAHTAAGLLRAYLTAEESGSRFENPVHTRTGTQLGPASWIEAQVRASHLGWPAPLF
ncbi:MAG: 3'-5' exonuclease [Ancrocorticia sp.]|uniref:3'-5' exonuclease n=1 Tax=Ancrocorticia sp. TaxID=2593684 RepID=UPI003F9293FB